MNKILIAVPTFETIYPDTFRSIWNLKKPEGYEILFDYVRGYDCARARNLIVDQAKKKGVDYLMMIDNDTVVPEDALEKLVSDDKDVIIGYYAHRNFSPKYDGRTNLCKLGEFNYNKQYSAAEIAELRDKGETVIQIHGGGLGCSLIKMSVFDHINYPYFDWTNYGSGYVLSEDLFFDENLRTHSIPIYADIRVECGHIFRYTQYCK